MSDNVNHPDHYNSHPSGVECITVIEHMSLNVGNAVKYLWRAGLKGPELEDLKKARWYIDREIARLGGKNPYDQGVAAALDGKGMEACLYDRSDKMKEWSEFSVGYENTKRQIEHNERMGKNA